MANITISHTREGGTLLDGSSKGDGVYEIVQQHGFRYGRRVGIYIRGSRDKEAQHWRINGAAEALRAAGHEVEIEIDEDDDRSFAEIEAAREGRAEERVERFSNRAGRAAAASDARRGAAHDISRRFEGGQPILAGHHSERSARRDRDRMHDNMRKSIEEDKRAGYWANRAEAADSHKQRRNDPYRTLRRLEKLRADLRQHERYHAEAAEKGYDSVDRHARRIRDLTKEIEHWEQVVEKAKADGVKDWGPDDFAAGDYALCFGSWYQVHRVNPKTLSIAWNLRLAPKQVMTLKDATGRGRVSTHLADYTQVRARCPEAAMAAFLAGGKVPGAKAAQTASEEQPASAVRAAQSAKRKSKGKKPSDPKLAKRVYVTCPIGGAEATLTWWNGNSRPHKDFKPVTITAEENAKFHRSVWSQPLQEKIEQILDGRGYALDGDDWMLSRDRSGFVRAIKPKPEPQAAPEPEQSEEPAAVADEHPAPDAPADESPAQRVPADVPAVRRRPEPNPERKVIGRRSAAELAGAAPVVERENKALTCENLDITRNQTDAPGVVNSDYTLKPDLRESTMTERSEQPRLTRRERKVAQIAEMCQRTPQRPEVERTAALDAAYRAYVDEGIASTDGWYAPLDFQAWAATLGADLTAAQVAGPMGEAPADKAVESGEEWPATDGPAVVELTADEGAGLHGGAGVGETPPACERAEEAQGHADPASVASSDYTRNADSVEPTTTTTAPPAKKATAPTKAAKPAPKAKSPRKKAPAKKATAAKTPTPAELRTVQKRVPVARIDRDPSQPRKEFDPVKLQELAGSMRKLGQLQPVSLRYVPGTKRYVLIMGERRWRAAQMAGITELDSVVTHGIAEGDRETLAKQVAENVGRADMTPIEEAKSFQRLVDAQYGVEEVAEMCGKSAAYVGWRIDLLRLCDAAQEALGKGHLPVGMAWYVSKLSYGNQTRFLAKYARGAFPNDRAAEEFVKACLAEEQRRVSQGSFFVLVDDTPGDVGDGSAQDVIPGVHDVTEEERERIMDERAKLTKKIDGLSAAGEVLSELAAADPKELALLLAGTPGGVPGHQMRLEHLAKLIGKASGTLRKAQAHAEVRASGVVVNPEAAAGAA